MKSLLEGDRISNYLLEARVGAGSFGEVWRARHHVFGDIVAIKIPTDAQYVRNLQREGVAVHGLHHPNIVRAIDLDPYGDPPYFIMEYVDGPSVREVVDQRRAQFPIPAAIGIMRGVLQALGAAHNSGIVHRDLKPANILLHQPPDDLGEGVERCVRITDFGLGHVGGATTESIMQSGSMQTEDGRSIAGTLAYMSPEQKEGRKVDARSDLYACGIVLFEMLTGERPPGSEVPGSLRPDVPEYLNDVFRKSYTRWDRRYTSAAEMLADLPSADSGPPAPPPPPPPSLGRGAHCPSCQESVHESDQFCIHCGRQIVESVPRCTACQAFVHASDQFCILCGNDLRVLR